MKGEGIRETVIPKISLSLSTLLAVHMPGIEYTPIPIKKVPKVQKRESPESSIPLLVSRNS